MSHRKKRKKLLIIPLIFLALCVFAVLYADRKTLYETKSTITLENYTNPEVKINFPVNAEAAVMVDNKVLDNNLNKPLATASTAKAITSLMVLQKYPLKLNQQGPLITLGSNDVTIYNQYLAIGGSVVKVISGEQISQYQALQAVLLPSSCNMSDSLAIWAFGSLDNYISYANQTLKKLGINNTVVAIDASGFSPETTSTPSDLIKIGQLVLNDPVLSQIVGQKTAEIPIQGQIRNVNWLLGTNGIVGIKTGNNDEDRGAFIFASTQPISSINSTKTIIGAIIGSDSLANALGDSIPIINSAKDGFKNATYPQANQRIGYYSVPWSNEKYYFVASESFNHQVWGKTILTPSIKIDKANYNTQVGSKVGVLSLASQNQDLVINKKIPRPSLIWEIKNIFKY